MKLITQHQYDKEFERRKNKEFKNVAYPAGQARAIVMDIKSQMDREFKVK